MPGIVPDDYKCRWVKAKYCQIKICTSGQTEIQESYEQVVLSCDAFELFFFFFKTSTLDILSCWSAEHGIQLHPLQRNSSSAAVLLCKPASQMRAAKPRTRAIKHHNLKSHFLLILFFNLVFPFPADLDSLE